MRPFGHVLSFSMLFFYHVACVIGRIICCFFLNLKFGPKLVSMYGFDFSRLTWCHSYRLVCLRWSPEVTVFVLSTWLVVFVLCHVLSSLYCLPPPVLLTNHCFSCSTCVSLVCLPIWHPGVCSPVLICCLTCVLCLTV